MSAVERFAIAVAVLCIGLGLAAWWPILRLSWQWWFG
jgi:hypothetical protein